MKSSILRCSFGSIHWSGLKLPLSSSPRGTGMAILQGKSETSNPSMRRAPLGPANKRLQLGSTPQASGETMPRPVTTTLRISTTLRLFLPALPPPIVTEVIGGAAHRAGAPAEALKALRRFAGAWEHPCPLSHFDAWPCLLERNQAAD